MLAGISWAILSPLYRAIRKKDHKLIHWFSGLAVACAGVFLLIATEPKQKPIELRVSDSEWKTHKESILHDMRHLSLALGPAELYFEARRLREEYDRCNYGGCSEMKSLCDHLMSMTENGKVAPKDAAETSFYASRVTAELLRIDSKRGARSTASK